MTDDYDLILFLSSTGPCSLNKSPKQNWVDKAGHLPNYICHIAKAVGRGGHSTSGAIAIAIGTVKRWAAGGGKVNAETRAKAARAVAQWEALKAKAHAGHMVKASNGYGEDFITLAAADASYNMDIVREAWERLQTLQQAHGPLDPDNDGDNDSSTEGDTDGDTVAAPRSWSWIREIWSDFIVVTVNGPDDTDTYKVPYTVSDGDEVDFGVPTRVKQAWIDQPDDDLTDAELKILKEELANQKPSDELKLTKVVRTPQGATRFKQPIGSMIQVDHEAQDNQPETVVRLISLYRQYKQIKDSGDEGQAKELLSKLHKALDAFPATAHNKSKLASIRKLLGS